MKRNVQSPRVAVLIPPATREECFVPDDWKRLRARSLVQKKR